VIEKSIHEVPETSGDLFNAMSVVAFRSSIKNLVRLIPDKTEKPSVIC
jgi:hypothetical protein